MSSTILRRTLTVLMSLVLVFSLACVPAMADAQQMALTTTAANGSVSINARLLADEDSGLLKLVVDMTDGENLITMGLAASESGICFTFEPLTNGWYGIDAVNFLPNLENSILHPGSGSAFALDQDTYDAVVESFTEGVSGAAAVITEAPAANTTPFDAYVELITEKLMSDVSTHQIRQNRDVNGTEYDVTISATTFGTQAVADMLTAVAEKLAEDESVDVFFPVQGDAEGPDSKTQLIEALNTLAQEVIEYNLTLGITSFTDNATDATIFAVASLGNQEEAVGIRLVNVPELKGIQLFTNSNGAEELVAGFECTAEGMDTNAPSFSFSVTENSKRTWVVTLDLAEDGTFALNSDSLDTRLCFSVKGAVTMEDENTAKFSVTEVNGEPSDLALTFGPVPSEDAPEFTEILAMDEDTFTAFLQIVETISSLF